MTHSRDEGDAWKKEPARAFSDGALAISITITIMVLELEVPHGSDMAALKPLLPVFLSYVLSFILLPYGAVLLVAAWPTTFCKASSSLTRDSTRNWPRPSGTISKGNSRRSSPRWGLRSRSSVRGWLGAFAFSWR